MKAVFVRGLPSGSEHAVELETFHRDPADFRAIPKSPFAYWASDATVLLFSEGTQTESGALQVKIGMTTHDDFRWLRLWWAAPAGCLSPLAKGGAYGRYYSDLHLGVRWDAGGRELVTSKAERGRLGELTENNSKLWNRHSYGQPGLTWTRRSQAGFSLRALPRDSFFGDKGPAILGDAGALEDVRMMLGLGNSSTYRYFLGLQMAFGSFETGTVRRTPIPSEIPAARGRELAVLGRKGWSLRRGLDTASETSHAFVAPAVLQVQGPTLGKRVAMWSQQVADVNAELSGLQSTVDDLCLELYGISDSDRRAIREGFGVIDTDADDAEADDDDGAEAGTVADSSVLAAGLVSWCVGVAVGRFDVRLAMGTRELPEEPDPFDPLPVASPGMLTDSEGLPSVEAPPDYPVEVVPVLVSDPGHALDVAARVRSVFDGLFAGNADVWWTDVGQALGARGAEVGDWLAKGFFEYHLKSHSKSRRKAPILWPLGTKSGSYLVWLYAHQVTSDSLFQVLHETINPKVVLEEQRLTQLRQVAGLSPTASQRREIDGQVGFVDELRGFAEKVEAVAPLWAPDLDDGIVIVLAPAWQLFAHHKAWSRELKSHWAKLGAGDYDWAHLAMHLWPERVVPKCMNDRSLAIAHGLENVFWVRDDTESDTWRPRQVSSEVVEDQIAKRRNPAVSVSLGAQ